MGVCLSVCLSVCLPVCLSVCLSDVNVLHIVADTVTVMTSVEVNSLPPFVG